MAITNKVLDGLLKDCHGPDDFTVLTDWLSS